MALAAAATKRLSSAAAEDACARHAGTGRATTSATWTKRCWKRGCSLESTRFLFDLGVSSPFRSTRPQRGFSFREERPRWTCGWTRGDNTLTAAELVNTLSTQQTSPGSSAPTPTSGGPAASRDFIVPRPREAAPLETTRAARRRHQGGHSRLSARRAGGHPCQAHVPGACASKSTASSTVLRRAAWKPPSAGRTPAGASAVISYHSPGGPRRSRTCFRRAFDEPLHLPARSSGVRVRRGARRSRCLPAKPIRPHRADEIERATPAPAAPSCALRKRSDRRNRRRDGPYADCKRSLNTERRQA